MEKQITCRIARPEDAEELLGIYAYYVEKTAISFEYVVPTVSEFEGRIRNILQKYPYIVAVSDGKIVGYAYAGAFHQRIAYQWNVETSIYIHKDYRKVGVGKILYTALEKVLRRQGVLNMNACIAYPDPEDEYVTLNSVQFHEHMGFHLNARFTNSGYKCGRWYDMVWMEKLIGEHIQNPKSVRLFTELEEREIHESLG